MNDANEPGGAGASSWLVVAAAWLAVGVPMLWGVWTVIQKASLLFR
jgi:hypothetical protein